MSVLEGAKHGQMYSLQIYERSIDEVMRQNFLQLIQSFAKGLEIDLGHGRVFRVISVLRKSLSRGCLTGLNVCLNPHA